MAKVSIINPVQLASGGTPSSVNIRPDCLSAEHRAAIMSDGLFSSFSANSRGPPCAQAVLQFSASCLFSGGVTQAAGQGWL